MRKILILLTVVLSSFYLFPFSFTALPSLNTKMVMAAFALLILLIQYAKHRDMRIDHSFMTITLIAIITSVIALSSTIINNTSDYTYATYIVSMWVWLAGAYTMISFMRLVHGTISVRIICNYLIAVCVMQCALALIIDFVPSVKMFVNSYIGSFGFNSSVGASEYERRNRLYGIGAALDFAGTRFSAVLIMIACIIKQNLDDKKKSLLLYLISFLAITIIGNMIARTTTIGAVIAIIYLTCHLSIVRDRKFIVLSSTLLIFAVFLVGVIYKASPIFRSYIEFGFEGFFSLIQTGEWQTNSGDILSSMVRFPETLKTWLIGDGYFDNPMSDIYYTGYAWKGFYMGTDIGYLRFVFYFGTLGLLSFMIFFYQVCRTCANKHPEYKSLFYMLLLLNFVIWFKVSTDIFVVFAPFLCISFNENSLSDPLDI